MAKFIEEKSTDEYEVYTEDGWKSFKGIAKTVPYGVYELQTENKSLKCADDHLVKTIHGFEKVINLKENDKISTIDGYESVKSVKYLGFEDNMYDLMDVQGHHYLTNQITSHNSTIAAAYVLWYSIFNSNKTVGIVSNKEASAKDILKRIKFMYEELPIWMKPGVEIYNKTSIIFDNNTEIVVSATTPDAFRGKSINCVTGDSKICIMNHFEIFYTTIECAMESWVPTFKILTNNGFKRFDGFISQGYKPTLQLHLSNGEILKATHDHQLLLKDGQFEYASNLTPQSQLENDISITKIVESQTKELVYDALNVQDEHSYWTNGVISHNCLLGDELGFVPANIADEFWSANYPTLSASETAKIIVISTPNGMFNLFHKLYSEAEQGKNTFVCSKHDYTVLPERDEEWAKIQIRNLGETKFNQEFGCVFIGSTNTVIDVATLNRIMLVNSTPIKYDLSGNFRIYENPIPNIMYVMGVDTAKGTGNNYSCCQVLKIISLNPLKLEQVAVFQDNKTDVYFFSDICHRIGLYYNKASIIVENNAEGSAIVNRLWWDFEYENLMNESTKRTGLGVRATNRTKPKAVLAMKKLLENDDLILNDIPTINELATFIEDDRGSFRGKDDKPDDLVSSLYWATYISEFDIFEEDVKIDLNVEDDVWGILSDVEEIETW